MASFHALVLTPPGPVASSLAIAASRAGGRGFLDLEYAAPGQVTVALRQLHDFTRTGFGVRLGRSAGDFFPDLFRLGSGRLRWVVLAGADHPERGRWVEELRRKGIEVLIEAVTLDEARRGAELQVDGLILKGHEAGGRVGDDTSFILLQRWLDWARTQALSGMPVYVQGGIGLNTAAACLQAGAAGVVLDAQLLLTRESPLAENLRQRLAGCDGSETLLLGERLGEAYRFFGRLVGPAVEELRRLEEQLLASAEPEPNPTNHPEAGPGTPGPASGWRLERWRQAVAAQVAAGPEKGLWLIGQDLAFAAPLAQRFETVGGILQAILQRAEHQAAQARQLRPLAPDSGFAKAHRTTYPIFQGPMTRVSDTAAFADAVSAAGGLPFLALALLRQAETENLLRETKTRLGDRAWGVGILGFVPPEIRQEQLEAIRVHRPPFALIAGGRPDQARELEKEGIPTYLHVPSPGLLRMFLRDQARRFIFEGRECGGHVGPRTSFVLWETMCEVLLEHVASTRRGDDLFVVFAGGIHDSVSAGMVAALAAGLVERGVSVGVLMGTAYLFTHEAVAAGAIVPRFQEEAVKCGGTVLLESGPGHAIRCIPSPYAEAFNAEKRRLQEEGKSAEEIRKALEWMNLGRLRVASKGVDRITQENGSGKLAPVSQDEQFTRGMYMIGQVAELRHGLCTMAELHAEVCSMDITESGRRDDKSEGVRAGAGTTPCDVAVIGMACFYPRSGSVRGLWDNILGKVDAVTEVPCTHWDWRLYYDPDPRAKDKIISKWGGFLDDVLFDPMVFGMPPNSLPSVEPLQLMLLEAVRQALAHAGYAERSFDRERTSAILGIGGGGGPVSVSYGLRACLPLLDTVPDMVEKASSIMKKMDPLLPEWTEDSFPGILSNVAAGRVANRFNFGGANYAIDAACASSLAALQHGIRELEYGTSDVSVVMGADTVQTPYAYVAFSKTHALSALGRCRPFDAAADGIVLSEGIGVVILKRLADAERDGDRIYAVLKGIGASSDGRDKGLTAPRAEGQLRALRRAYAAAGVSPAQVGLVEAHGTGTVVGDKTEAQALRDMFIESGAAEASCALGSVKSLIGHSKCAAGLAGLIKTVLALHHKVLPPTQVEKPNAKAGLDHGPLFLNTEARPWIQGNGQPRRAGVSAFGFGGTNFHVVVEEYTGDFLNRVDSPLPTWPVELLVWRRPTRAALVDELKKAQQALTRGARPVLAEWAWSLVKALPAETNLPTLAIVTTSVDDAKEKLANALKALQTPNEPEALATVGPVANASGSFKTFADPRGVWFAEAPATQGGKVAVLFPGQGSQYVNMLAQTAMAFPWVREVLDRADVALRGRLEWQLSRFVYPPSAFTPEQEQHARAELTRTEVAQPAVGATSLALWRLLHDRLGVRPDFLAGHSYGEYVALCAAGALTEEDLFRVSHRRGAIIHDATARMPGAMAALEAPARLVADYLAEARSKRTPPSHLGGSLGQVSLANLNSPGQTVISGSEDGITAALQALKEKGVRGQRLPVACGFHSPLVAPAQEPLAAALRELTFAAPRYPVYSNVTAAPYPASPAEMTALLSTHLTSPVRFAEQVEALHQAGARVFIEVGPQGVLTGLVGQILKDRPHLAVALDNRNKPGLVQLQQALAQALVYGVPLQLDRLHEHRDLRAFDLTQLDRQTGHPKVSASTWLVNSVRSKPINAPEPRLIGQTRPPEPATPSRTASMNKPASPAVSERPASANQPAAPAAPAPAPVVARSPDRATTGGDRATTAPAQQAPPVPAVPVLADEASQVVLRFQDLMARFLDTQKSVMLTYLQGGPVTLPSPAPLPSFTPPPVAVGTNGNGYENGNGHAPLKLPPIPIASLAPVAAPVAAAPVAPEKPSPVVPSPDAGVRAAKTALDRDGMLAKLLDLVSQRTGYPKEMLDLDLDVEADLGIDSIKRVEILGGLAESLDGIDLTANLEMEKLTTIRTLRGIVEYLDQVQNKAPVGTGGSLVSPSTPRLTSEPPVPTGSRAVANAVREGDVQRLVVRLVDAPLPEQPLLLNYAGPLLLTDDGRGVAQALAEKLSELGQATVLLRQCGPVSPKPEAGDSYSADLTDPVAVAAVLERIRQEVGPLAGLLHLLPLGGALRDEAPQDRARREVKSLYLLARQLEAGFRDQGQQGNAVLLAATGLGGRLAIGEEPLPADYFAGQGGVLGFVKSVAQEWPEVLVRGIDLDGDRPVAELAERLLGELGDMDGPLEVGYAGSRRVTTLTVPAPLGDLNGHVAIELGPQSTVLVTGGARGITAAVALELARRYRPTLVLVGRSPLPDEEADDTAVLSTPAEIKAALIAQMQGRGQPVTPAVVESAYQRLLIDREIRGNLNRLRQAGAQVHYRAVDVRDEAAVVQLLQAVEEQFGGLDGVIHGAGVIEDRLLRDKTPESFERVFGTKVDSALILSRHLRPGRLKFWVLFSSIAGRYGNRGQSDYAAANEVLAKLADEHNRRWSARVVSIAWGPWSGLGMVADLEKHLVQRGLKLIAPEVGSRMVVEELQLGSKADAEVVIAGGSEHLARPARPARQTEAVGS